MPRTPRHLVVLLASLAVTAAAVVPAAAQAAPPSVPADAFTSAGSREAWYELRLPAQPPKGIVLEFHPGGWEAVGAQYVRQVSGYRGGELQRKWRARGLITVTSSYRAGKDGFVDVVTLYDQLHARYPQLPIGAYGQSSGAHLALLLGAARELAFVVSDAGPTNWATWKSTYPCFYRSCASVGTFGGQQFTGVGATWVDVTVANAFGAAGAPSPNMNDYDVAPNYDATLGPDPFLIYGRRMSPTDPSQATIPDGTPTDGPQNNAYIDVDGVITTIGDQLEVDPTVTQQQGVLLKDRVGARAVLRTLPKGTAPWVHGPVDGAAAAAVYDEMIEWTAAKLAAAAPAPAVPERQNLGLGNLADQPVGIYVVRGCNGAPGRSGIFSTGAWTPSLSDVAGLDVTESGCSTRQSAAGAGEGMQLRTEPASPGLVPQDAVASMTFPAPPGTTIASYGASYHGARTSNAWQMSLDARDAGGAAQTLTGCPAGAACPTRANHLISPDTTDATSGPYAPQTFAAPAGTVALTWQLTCRQTGGCPGGASNNTADLNQQAFVNVYSSAVYVNDPAAPAALLTGDFADGRPHAGPLTGTVEASDTGAGVRRVEVTFAGSTTTTTSDCDYSRPRPCPASTSIPLTGDTAGLPEGPAQVTITVTDGAGRSTTQTGGVTVQNLAPVVSFRGSAVAPPAPADPFAVGRGRAQLASCTTRPEVISARLTGRRLQVTAAASASLVGSRATLRVGDKSLAQGTIRADGTVLLRRSLKPAQLRTTFSVSAGGRASPRLAVRARVTLVARRSADRVNFSGTVRRGGGRRVQIQQLVGCGRWRTIAAANASRSGRFRSTLDAAGPPGAAYRATVAAPRSLMRSLGPRATSTVAAI